MSDICDALIVEVSVNNNCSGTRMPIGLMYLYKGPRSHVSSGNGRGCPTDWVC